MLATVDIDRAKILGILEFVPEDTVLGALVTIKKDLVKHVIEVLEHARDDFVEDVNVDTVVATLGLLLVTPVLEDLADGLGCWKSHDAAVFGDALPVIHDEGLQVVRHHDANAGTGVEVLLL